MKGILDIYIERKTYRLSILVYHTNKIGFGEAIGKIADITDVSCLKKSVEDAMALSLSEYKSDKKNAMLLNLQNIRLGISFLMHIMLFK